MKRLLAISLSVLIAPVLMAPRHAAAAGGKSHAPVNSVDPDDAYKDNCMRCHAALPQFSPRMSKPIMMHMRVAANLPADQALAIYRYLTGESPAPAQPARKAASPQQQ